MATSQVTQKSQDVFKTGSAGKSSTVAVKGIQQTDQVKTGAEVSGVQTAISAAAKNLVESGIDIKGASIERETGRSFDALSAATVAAEGLSSVGGLGDDIQDLEGAEESIRDTLMREMGLKDVNAPGVDEAFTDFTKLREAQKSGAITADEVRIRARAKLTDLKNTYPGFSDEIVKVAASRLGRDVTSSDFTDAVTRLNASEAARAKAASATPLDQAARKEVEELVFLQYDRPTAMRMVANKRAYQLQSQAFTAQTAANAAFSEDYARQSRGAQQQAATNSINMILALNKAGGTNEQDMLLAITNSFAKERLVFQQKSTGTRDVAGPGGFGVQTATISQSMSDTALQALTTTENNVKAMFTDNSLTAWYEQATKANTAAAEFFVSNIPGIAGMHATVGKEQTGVFLETIFEHIGKPGALSARASVDDKLAGQLSMFDFFGKGQQPFVDLLEGKTSNNKEGLQVQQIFLGNQISSPALPDKGKLQAHSNGLKVVGETQLLESYNNPEALKSVINNPGQRKVFAETLSKARVKTSKAFAAEIMLAREFEDPDNPISLAIEDGRIVIKGEVLVSKLQPAAPGVSVEDPAVTATRALRGARSMTRALEQQIQLHNLYEGAGVIQEGDGTQTPQERFFSDLSNLIKQATPPLRKRQTKRSPQGAIQGGFLVGVYCPSRLSRRTGATIQTS